MWIYLNVLFGCYDNVLNCSPFSLLPFLTCQINILFRETFCKWKYSIQFDIITGTYFYRICSCINIDTIINVHGFLNIICLNKLNSDFLFLYFNNLMVITGCDFYDKYQPMLFKCYSLHIFKWMVYCS